MNAAKTMENIEISPKHPSEYTPNAVTLAALREAEVIAGGEVPSAVFIDPARCRTLEELKASLKQALQS
jgi:hypothetical protein